MKEYKEDDAKRELEELLQIIPVRTKNQEFIRELNENIKNREYRLALNKVERFLDESNEQKEEEKLVPVIVRIPKYKKNMLEKIQIQNMVYLVE